MSNELNVVANEEVVETVETTEATDVVVSETKKEKVEKIAVPTLTAVTPIEVEAKSVLAVEVSTGEEYAQVNAMVNECKDIVSISNQKQEFLRVPLAKEQNIAAVKTYILGSDAEIDAAELIVVLNFGDYKKTSRSVKNTTGSKAKSVTSKSVFFDDLAGVTTKTSGQGEDAYTYNYIYAAGEPNDPEFTREKNTAIIRVIKNLVPNKKLYSDEDKTGFHKAQSRIPAGDPMLRTADNYSYYIKWEEIRAKMDKAHAEDANIPDGQTTIDNIVKIINVTYPDIVVDTSVDLYLESLKSLFKVAPKFLTYREEEVEGEIVGSYVDIKAEKDAAAAADKLAKKAEREKAAADKKAAKKAAAKETEGEEVADLGADAPALEEMPAIDGEASLEEMPALGGVEEMPTLGGADVAEMPTLES